MPEKIIMCIEALIDKMPASKRNMEFLKNNPYGFSVNSKAGPNLNGAEWEGAGHCCASRAEAYADLQEYEDKVKKRLEAQYQRPVEVKRNVVDTTGEKDEEKQEEKSRGGTVEFKVLGQLKTEGEKTNSKGEVVDVDITGFSLMEQKPKGSTGVPIKIQIKCEGTHLPDFMVGDIIEFKKKTSQTKLTPGEVKKPEAKLPAPLIQSQARKRNHAKKA
jgi:hypothetical protein